MPGMSAPFNVIFKEQIDMVADYDLSVEYLESLNSEYEPTYYEGIEIVNSTGLLNGIDYELSGEVANYGDEDVNFVLIEAALFNKDGEIIGVVFTYAAGEDETLDVGATMPFDVWIPRHVEDTEIASYELFVNAKPIE
ncbi:unnamed protein product [marine sediment metagenome]|uniref:Uncharacterized protein n=1 Tax=marine sediment metagenome TaxID=412755 RepID=X0W2X2_9ZZZZ